MIFLIAGDLGIPVPDQLNVLFHLIRFDFVEDNAVHILSPRELLAETPLDLLVHLAALLCAVDQARELAATSSTLLTLGLGGLRACGFC